MTGYGFALAVHIAAGSVALATFWLAALMRKGTPRHRLIGRIYLLAMTAIIASGLPLAWTAMRSGRSITALFLTYLLLLVGVACWNAFRAIRDRRDRRRYFGPLFWTLQAVLALYGLGMIRLGLETGPLLAVFGSVGVLGAFGSLRAWRRAAGNPLWWLREHYSAMIGNGVATHIAFLGIGLRNALPGVDPQLQQSLAWFGPLALSLVAAWWLSRKYGRREPAARRIAPAVQRAAS